MCALCMCSTRVIAFKGTIICTCVAFSLPWMYMRAHTFCIVSLCWNHVMRCTMEFMRSLCGWICHVNGHRVWCIYKVYAIEVVNKYVYIVWVFWVLATTSYMIYNVA